MATGILTCRVCGKKYEACRSEKRVDGVFRWKDVACSPECGAVYLANIRASRAKTDNTGLSENEKNAYALYDAEYEDEYDTDLLEDYDEDEDGDET